jgi:predicted transcriptional regulator
MFGLLTPRLMYRDKRLSPLDCVLFLVAVDEGMLDALEPREIKLEVLAVELHVNKSTVSRALDRLVEAEYLARTDGPLPTSPKKYRIRLSALAKKA